MALKWRSVMRWKVKESMAFAWKQNVAWLGLTWFWVTWLGTAQNVQEFFQWFLTRDTPLRQPLWRSLDRGKPKSPLGIRGGKEVCQGRRIQTKFMARIPRGKHGFGESYQDADKFVRKQRNCERTRRVKRINSWWTSFSFFFSLLNWIFSVVN